jgi:hypothetical protein
MTAKLILLFILTTVSAAAAESPPRHLSRETLEDKIRGGWAGKMFGVAYGAPTEF